MLFNFLSAVAAGSAVASAASIKRSVPDGVVAIDFDKVAVPIDHSALSSAERLRAIRGGSNAKRANTETLSLANQVYAYYASLTVGTPGQPLSLQIDTGSSDLWGIYAKDTECATTQDEISEGWPDCSSNVFDYALSSTWEFTNENFDIQYLDWTSAKGKWGTDVVDLGGSISLQGAWFGLGEVANASSGVFGVGFQTQESTYPYEYPNIPVQLKQDGLIGVNAYSLYLNEESTASGSLLFGGVDSDKYTGSLYTVPIVSDDAFFVDLNSIAFTPGSGKAKTLSTSTQQAVLDSGTTISFIPSSAASAIISGVGAKYNSDVEGYIVPCSNNAGSIQYTFSGATINVPIKEVLIPVYLTNGEVYTQNGQEICQVGIASTDDSDGIVILGDTFLRAAYVVYDLDNAEISLAQVKYSSSSNIKAITSAGVPGAVNAPDY